MSTTPVPIATVSHYRLIEPLGRGAMGEVWLAEDTELPRKVAVKLLPRHLEHDRNAVDRLLNEARAVATVDHPNVVSIYEAGIAEGRAFLVMQRVEGESLEERLTRGPLPLVEAVALARAIADALAEVHALGIVHRDLKPANIILTPRGPKILDFGVASIKGAPGLTSTGTSLGTPLFMSPEQMKGQPPDNRSDLWSLGVTLYESITGVRPFEGKTFAEVMHAILNLQPQPPSAIRREVGTDLDYVVMKLLRKDPTHRYARAEELIADLECEVCLTGEVEGLDPRAKSGGPRLVALPFEVMSNDPDDAFLANGLVEDLIVDITRLGALQVASRAEVAPYRDRTVPPRTLARELGADYVLLGSVRRAGNRARISTQLVRASDGHAVWAERFDRTLEDLFDVQAEVAKRIVEALQVALKPGELEMLNRAPTRNREAYEFFLRAYDLIDRSREDNRRAEELLKRAIELDPDFALAHATLGQCYAFRGLRWWAGPEVAEIAMPLADRALALEPDLFEAHMLRAMVYRLRGESEKLMRALESVSAMNPDNPLALEWAGWSYMTLDKPEQAIPLLERMLDRHPDSYVASSYLETCFEMTGRSAEEVARMHARTLESEMEYVRRHPDEALARAFLGISLIRDGEVEPGTVQLERALEIAPNDGRIRYNAACGFARAGMKERAIHELKEGTKRLQGFIGDWPSRDPDLESLHEEPEFIAMFGGARG
jgi:TolB-like protein/Tfp pilus assembly protein PilF/predicted Ser/Thr protein kinase